MATLARIAADRNAPPAAQVAAAQALLDRAWGRAPVSVEATGKDGAPLYPTLLVTFATSPAENEVLTIEGSASDADADRAH
jgi:hypothetical protein